MYKAAWKKMDDRHKIYSKLNPVKRCLQNGYMKRYYIASF